MKRCQVDIVLLGLVIFLSIFGIIMVYSASNVVALEKYNDSFYFFKKQAMFLVLSWVVVGLLIKYDIAKLEKYSAFIFIFCLILLFLVLIPGVGVVRGGARSWIGVGSLSIQPSEFMKLGIMAIYAKYLKDNYRDLKNFKDFIVLFCLGVVVFLIIMLQPDFGTGLVILASVIILIYASGVPMKYLMVIVAIGLAGGVFLIASAPYRIERILAYINPWNDPLGSGFQGIQSLFAITPGGLFGHGFNQSIQKHFFLPEPQNDFIFAILIEELGLIAGVIVLAAYFIIFVRGIKISLSVDNNYLKFLGLGIVISLFVQVFINVGVVIGLLPVTGITLPLFSYGGSSLLLTMISFGILLSISRYRNYDYREV